MESDIGQKTSEMRRARVAILKNEKIAKFGSENSQNSQLIFENSHKLATFQCKSIRTTK